LAVRGYTGLFGSGKTLAMVREGYAARKRNPDVRVMTNLPRLELPGRPVENLNDCDSYEEVLQKMLAFKDGYLLLDEVGVYLPSRRWNKVADELMAKWQQSRKDQVEMRWTCIRPSQVVKDIRDITWETAWCSSYRMLGFFMVNWYSYTAVQQKAFFQYRYLIWLRAGLSSSLYDTMSKVDPFLRAAASAEPPAPVKG